MSEYNSKTLISSQPLLIVRAIIGAISGDEVYTEQIVNKYGSSAYCHMIQVYYADVCRHDNTDESTDPLDSLGKISGCDSPNKSFATLARQLMSSLACRFVISGDNNYQDTSIGPSCDYMQTSVTTWCGYYLDDTDRILRVEMQEDDKWCGMARCTCTGKYMCDMCADQYATCSYTDITYSVDVVNSTQLFDEDRQILEVLGEKFGWDKLIKQVTPHAHHQL
jgi:hypothetical protein